MESIADPFAVSKREAYRLWLEDEPEPFAPTANGRPPINVIQSPRGAEPKACPESLEGNLSPVPQRLLSRRPPYEGGL